MSTLLKQECQEESLIIQGIEQHAAWHGKMSGLKAEKLLRGRKIPYLYVLRAGEFEGDYYVTFVRADLSVHHQPFVITVKSEGWFFEQGGQGGPFPQSTSIDDVLHLMMHCNKQAPIARAAKD